MTDYTTITLGKIGDTPFTLDDLIFQLKTNLEQSIVDDAVHSVILRKVADDLSLSVSDEELQKAADDFRRETGLISASETMEWIEEYSLTVDDFEKKLENDLLKSKVETALATEEKVNKLFAENILDFEKANISKIMVNDAGLAEEIMTQLNEDEEDFITLATKYSVDSDKGGYVSRSDLPDEVDVLVFGDDAPELIGPVKAEGGYYIVKILEPKKADPSDELTRAACIKTIFDDYMAEKGQEMGVKLDFISED